MFKKIFALALVLILVALCARKPPPDPVAARLPNTCATAQFAAVVGEFDALSARRADALKRVEAIPVDEPAEYVRLWKREGEVLSELSSAAERVEAPRCLAHAKELFLQQLAQTRTALSLRAPDRDFLDYRRARETADAIHGQYLREIRLQETNRQ
jgi:hypothetical protein